MKHQSWTKQDKLLFHIVNTFGKPFTIKASNKVIDTYLKLKTKPNIIFFGSYDQSSNTFYWMNKMNEVSLDMARKNYMSVFGSDETIAKLCRPEVHLDIKNKDVIAYLMDIFNAAFSIIRIKKGSETIYGMVKLGIQDSFDFDGFNNAMGVYRLSVQINKRKTFKKHRLHRKTRKY